jgi:hypothetical protein
VIDDVGVDFIRRNEGPSSIGAMVVELWIALRSKSNRKKAEETLKVAMERKKPYLLATWWERQAGSIADASSSRAPVGIDAGNRPDNSGQGRMINKDMQSFEDGRTVFPDRIQVTPRLKAKRQSIVRRVRKSKGRDMTMAAFARHVHKSSTAIYGMINGERTRYGTEALEDFLRTMGVSQEEWNGEDLSNRGQDIPKS